MTHPTNPSDPGLSLEWEPPAAHRVPKAVSARMPSMNRTISLRLPDKMADLVEETYLAMKPYGYGSLADFMRDAMWKWSVYCIERYHNYSRALNAKAMGLASVLRVAEEHDDRRAYEQALRTVDTFLEELVLEGGPAARQKLAEIFLGFAADIEKVPDQYWAARYKKVLARLENFDAAARLLQDDPMWASTGIVGEMEEWQVLAARVVTEESE